MKKLSFLTALMFAFGMMANAQNPLQSVGYRGAFAPGVAQWTDGWCNWDPQNTTYGTATDTTTLVGHITKNTTLNAGTVYRLSGIVYVDSNVNLTIPAGTVIRGNSAIANSCLMVRRGGNLIARGTATNPIVFTSDKSVGSRNYGDWGGIILLGRGVVNQGIANIEGVADADEHKYGGNDNADNCGVLSYVRIEFGGYVFAQNKEINGLTMGGVGSGTTIDHIQCSFTNDDSFEWFGGAVNCKYLVAYRGVDDDFDTDFGYSGTVQFGLGVRDPQVADPTYSLPSGASTSEGFESDNDANGSYLFPRTSAVFSNMTMVGPYRGNNASTVHPAFRRGARIRRNSGLRIINTVWTDWATGVFIDGSATYNNITANRVDSSALVSGNVISNYKTRVYEGNTALNGLAYLGDRNDTIKSNYSLMTNPYSFTNPDFRPAAGSILNWGSTFSVSDAGTGNYVSGKTTCNTVSNAGVGITSSATNLCNAFNGIDTLTFSVPVTKNVSSYTWSVTNGTVISGQGTPTIQVLLSSGPLRRTITANLSNYCSTSPATRSILSVAPSTLPVISSTTAGVCAIKGTATNATYSVAPVSGVASYNWTVPTGATIVSGQGTTSIDVNFSNTFVSGKIYCTGVSPCGNTPSAYFNVELVDRPAITGPSSLCAGDTGVYSIPTIANASKYFFQVPAGLVIVSQTANSIQVINDGSFVAGKIAAKYYTTTCGIGNPSFISVNTASCRNAAKETMAIYPNPNNGQFEVRFGSMVNNGLIQILDMTGKVVFTQSVNGTYQTINATSLQNGMYLVKTTVNGVSQVSKINVAK
jgi:hypothetical protein